MNTWISGKIPFTLTFNILEAFIRRQWREWGEWLRSPTYNLSQLISSALDLWPLSQTVFTLQAACRCLIYLSGAVLDGHSSISSRNMQGNPLTGSTLVPSMHFRLCVYVCHCLLNPLAAYVRFSLARRWPLNEEMLFRAISWRNLWVK